MIQLNYGNDPADQIVRYTLDGAEVVLKLSGMAAKQFALFAYAVLKGQKKTRGKTRLVRMLREQRDFKFFKVPADKMKEFAKEAKGHGLLYVPIRNRKKKDDIELVVFSDDASKVSRVLDNLNLDFVQAQTGEATVESVKKQENQAPVVSAPSKTETVQTEKGAVDFEVGGFEDDFHITADGGNFTRENFPRGREEDSGEPTTKKSLSAPSSPSKDPSSAPDAPEPQPGGKPSVKKELQEIRQEQAAKKAEKTKPPEHQQAAPSRSRQKKKKKQKGR